ncbi:MAG: hydroxymethylbilane synthase, partial [Acidimicrobiaceae bacterium]|nr:hydroxymethylbilane synthase [Acidimicrobiaceae bacterium]
MLRLATRRSPLARWQAGEVARLLRQAHPGLETELVDVDTAGDRHKDRPLTEVGGQGVFVKEVQAAVLEGRADLAVHSAKDLQSVETDGLVLAAFPPRADPRDALVGTPLAELAPGATVATGSVRRRAQLAWHRPDLRFADLRGNIATRLERVPPGGAVIMAQAALDRLGLGARAAEILDPEVMLPQVGQGAMAAECRSDDPSTIALLEAIDHPPTAIAVRTERAFLARLGSGCSLPVAAHATLDESGAGPTILIEGLIAATDGTALVRRRMSGPAARTEQAGAHQIGTALIGAGQIGAQLADALLATP